MVDLPDSVASCAGTSATRELPPKYITLEEVVDEAMLLLSHSAPNITEEIPVFTAWVENALKDSILLRKRISYKWYQPSSRKVTYERIQISRKFR